MKILVVGAGAVGGYFGARLAQAGRDVTFLVRPSRAQHLRSEGLRIVSPHGDLTLQPQTITAEDLHEPFDIIFLSVKAQTLDPAMDDMAPAVGPDTMIYPVLNGMRHIETLTRRFGERPVLGGVCMVATDLDEQGCIVQISPMQKLTYGELSGEITSRIRSFDETMRNAGFETELSTGIMQAMWHKWVMIASLGLVTCLLDGPVGEINAVPYGDETSLRAIEECAAVAAACGFPPPQPSSKIFASVGPPRAPISPRPCTETCNEARPSKSTPSSAICSITAAPTMSTRLFSRPAASVSASTRTR
jgi:2-dehydropantoate 2-reductase